MLRNVIESSKVVEIYKVSEEVKRGQLVVKNEVNKTAAKADGVGVQVQIVDFDAQPMGHLSDLEVSQYSAEMDTIPANTNAILVTYAVGGQFAVDQVEGTFVAGDYAVAKEGNFTKAVAGEVSKFKYVGTYMDGDKKLERFEVVDPHTVA